MPKFRVEVKDPAARQIEKLSPPVARRILAALESLAGNPYPRGDTVKRLKGHEALYRLRIGRYQIRHMLGFESRRLFAARFGFAPASVRNWEQARTRPDGPARILLAVIAKHPEAVEDALRPP